VPIRLRLAALFAAGTALLIAVGGTIFVNELSGGLTNSVATGLEARASVLLAPNTAGQPLAASLERPNAPNGTAEFAQVLSTSGRIIDSAGPGSRRPILGRAELA
jgi:two-component system OmpR family sensor kinase